MPASAQRSIPSDPAPTGPALPTEDALPESLTACSLEPGENAVSLPEQNTNTLLDSYRATQQKVEKLAAEVWGLI